MHPVLNNNLFLVKERTATLGAFNSIEVYNPQTQQLYVCATDRLSTFRVQDPLSEPGDNVVYMGGNFAQAPVDDRGLFGAIDFADQYDRVAARVAGNVLQRQYQYGRWTAICRPQRWPADRAG